MQQVAISKGFCSFHHVYSVFQVLSLVNIVFYTLQGSTWSVVQNPPHFHSQPVATLFLIHEPCRLSTFVEFNADLAHFGPHKKKSPHSASAIILSWGPRIYITPLSPTSHPTQPFGANKRPIQPETTTIIYWVLGNPNPYENCSHNQPQSLPSKID